MITHECTDKTESTFSECIKIAITIAKSSTQHKALQLYCILVDNMCFRHLLKAHLLDWSCSTYCAV